LALGGAAAGIYGYSETQLASEQDHYAKERLEFAAHHDLSAVAHDDLWALLGAYTKLAQVQEEQHHLDEALTSYQKGLAVMERINESEAQSRDPALKDDPIITALASQKWNWNKFWQLETKIGDLQKMQGKLQDALSTYFETLAIAKYYAEGNPNETFSQAALAESYEKIGEIQLAQNKLTEALESAQSGVRSESVLPVSSTRHFGRSIFPRHT
jgi:tetratricopeptide (TPR) repeat protein